MIGSKRKVINVIKELEKEAARVFAPMVLEIGAVSPEEIAVSVVAEMIAVRRNADSDWRALSKAVFAGEFLRALLLKISADWAWAAASRGAWARRRRCWSFRERLFWTG